MEMVSHTQLQISPHYARTHAPKNCKLVPNLMPKKNYIIYYRNLKFYLDHGLRLGKAHRVICFAQTRWMEPSICMNTWMRAAARSDLEKEFHM